MVQFVMLDDRGCYEIVETVYMEDTWWGKNAMRRCGYIRSAVATINVRTLLSSPPFDE